MLVMIDLDNTLSDRTAAVNAWIHEFCRQIPLPDSASDWFAEIDNDGYSSRDEVFATMKERYGLSRSIDELVRDYRRRVVELVRPTPGASGQRGLTPMSVCRR